MPPPPDRRSHAVLPVALCGEGRTALVVGGGPVGARKVEALRSGGFRVELVSPDAVPELHALAGEGLLFWHRQSWDPAFPLERFSIVVAATNSPAINAAVEAAARAVGAWVNRADAPERCDFFTSAVVRSPRHGVAIGINTEGRSPTASGRIRRWLEARLAELPPGFFDGEPPSPAPTSIDEAPGPPPV